MDDTVKLRSFLSLWILLCCIIANFQANCATTATTSGSMAGPCVFSPTTDVRDTLQEFLTDGASLVYINLRFEGEAESSGTFIRLERDLGIFKPWSWQRSTSRQGRSLLMLSENYDVLSLSLLSIRVDNLDVTLTSSPAGCVHNMTSREVYTAIRDLLLNDFKMSKEDHTSGSLSRDEHVCYREVRAGHNNVADFLYVCCHNDPDGPQRTKGEITHGGVVCSDVRRDPWISVLLAAVLVIKILVVLFSPNLLPETVYRLKYATLRYVYHLHDYQKITLRMLKTKTPWIYGNNDHVVRLSTLPGMPQLREMVAKWEADRVQDVTVKQVQLAIKARKLLGENYVPVGLFKIVYNNLFLCRLRHLSALTSCCSANILGVLNPGLNVPTWFKCARLFARIVLLLVMVVPWAIRLLIYYHYEHPVQEDKVRSAVTAGLAMPFSGSFTLYLTPLHLFFVACYIILCLDSLIYGVLSEAVKQKMKLVLWRCLRDMKERSKLSVCGWVTSILVLPCTFCGLLGLLLFPLFLPIVLPLLLPILAFYLFPAVNLSLRLLLHVFIFMCPSRVTRIARRLWKKAVSPINKHIKFETLAAEESFENRSSFSQWELPFQVLVVLVCLVSFWSVTFLVMELLSFVVEMAVYTFIGLIVTADITSQYLSVIFFLLLYGNRCFSAIHSKYLNYHQVLHHQLVAMMRAEIDSIARTEELDQENTALRVQGDMATPAATPPLTLRVHEGRPRWATSSMLLFLDSKDTPYTPERFFGETLNLNYCGCPGQLYSNFLAALWNFIKIIVFLLFVFVVVMAFGSAYRVSSTNQLLATVAGGFIPFVFTHFFASSNQGASVDPDSVQFKTQFHTAINRYKQTWPVFDISPDDTKLKQAEHTKPDGDETKIAESSNPLNVPPLSSSTPYSTLTSSKPPSSVTSEKAESVDWEDTSLDIIFDVSPRGWRGARAHTNLAETEAGSQTMLDKRGSNNDNGAGGGSSELRSPRKYRPSEPSLHESDELLNV